MCAPECVSEGWKQVRKSNRERMMRGKKYAEKKYAERSLQKPKPARKRCCRGIGNHAWNSDRWGRIFARDLRPWPRWSILSIEYVPRSSKPTPATEPNVAPTGRFPPPKVVTRSGWRLKDEKSTAEVREMRLHRHTVWLYLRCHCICAVIWWYFILKTGYIRCTKITWDGRTYGRTELQTRHLIEKRSSRQFAGYLLC